MSADLTQAEHDALAECIRRAFEMRDQPGKAEIAAAILKDGVTLARGENEVYLDHDPTRHAEIVAMGRATAALGVPDLSGCTLVSSLQPCEMCLAAMRFAGIRRVIFAATQEKVASKYFFFPGLRIGDHAAADKEGFDWIGGVMEDEVLPLYADGEA